MTYDSLLADLVSASEFFVNVLTRVIVWINSEPLLVLAVFVTLSLPALYLIFAFVSDLSNSSDEVTAEGFAIYRRIKSFKIKKEIKEERKKFHQNKNFVRYRNGYNNNYYQHYQKSTTNARSLGANIDVVCDD